MLRGADTCAEFVKLRESWWHAAKCAIERRIANASVEEIAAGDYIKDRAMEALFRHHLHCPQCFSEFERLDSQHP